MDTTMPSAAVMDHLNHVTYPASKEDLKEACEKMSDIDEKDKMWFMESLPDLVWWLQPELASKMPERKI